MTSEPMRSCYGLLRWLVAVGETFVFRVILFPCPHCLCGVSLSLVVVLVSCGISFGFIDQLSSIGQSCLPV